MFDGREITRAALVVTCHRVPDLRDGYVGFSGSASLRSSHLRVAVLGGIKKLEIGSLDIKGALLHAAGFSRGVLLRAPA